MPKQLLSICNTNRYIRFKFRTGSCQLTPRQGSVRKKFGSALVTGLALILTACGPEQLIQSSESLPQSTAVSQTQADSMMPKAVSSNLIPIGEWGNVRADRAIQVSSSKVGAEIFSVAYGFDTIDPKGGQLAVVFMTLKNTGSESGDLDWSGFQLVDGQGRKYAALEDWEDIFIFNRWLKENGLGESDEQLFPGATVQTAKAFRVAPDASGLMLSVNKVLFEIQPLQPSSTVRTAMVEQPDSTNSDTSTRERSRSMPRLSSSPVVRHGPSQIVQAKDGYANLRSQASTEVNVIAKVPNGTTIEILDQQTNSSGQLWYKVEVNGQIGWLFSELVQSSEQNLSLQTGTYRTKGSNYIQIVSRGTRLCYRGSSNAGTITASLSPIADQPGSYRIYNIDNRIASDKEAEIVSQDQLNSYEVSNEFSNAIDEDLENCLSASGNYFNQHSDSRERS